MSQSGQVVFFTAQLLDPKQTCAEVLKLTRATNVVDVHRSRGEDRAWESFRAAIAQREDLGQRDLAVVRASSMDESYEYIPSSSITIENIADLYEADRSLRVSLRGTEVFIVLDSALREAIPEEVRGGFVPSGVGFTIGWHDIFEYAEHEHGRLFGRAFFSLRLFGHGTPNRWEEYRRRVLTVPEIREIRTRIEEVVGPVESCVYWEV